MSNKTKGRMHEWMETDIREDKKRLGQWIRRKKIAILIVVFWSIAIGLVFIRAYYFLYATTPILWDKEYRLIYAPTYSALIPRLSIIDHLLILIVSLIAGFAIADIETTLFGFLVSIILSVAIGTAYSACFIWFVLEAGSIFDSSFISAVIFAAFLNIFRMIFPISVLTTFFGGIFGSVIRGFIQPSAQD